MNFELEGRRQPSKFSLVLVGRYNVFIIFFLHGARLGVWKIDFELGRKAVFEIFSFFGYKVFIIFFFFFFFKVQDRNKYTLYSTNWNLIIQIRNEFFSFLLVHNSLLCTNFWDHWNNSALDRVKSCDPATTWEETREQKKRNFTSGWKEQPWKWGM